MTSLLACIDGSIYSQSVADHAAWAAERLGASVTLMRVIGRREPSSEDRSGRIIAGARRQLLEQLATLDAERAKLAMQEARLSLDELITGLDERGLTAETVLRHGDLLKALADCEDAADMLVMGKRGEAADFAKMHLGSNLERVLRGVQLPVLVASRAFKPIEKFMIAFDGRTSALKAVDAASRSPVFAGLSGIIATAGEPNVALQAKLEAAAAQLKAGGLQVETRVLSQSPGVALPAAVAEEGVDLLVMGAFGHSRLRSLVIGSTTAEVIRGSLIPVLVYR